MKSLWTPWRMGYILGEKPEGCLFCMKQREPWDNDRENHILYRGATCYMMLNLFPYTNGHMMIAPYSHVASLEQLDDKPLHEMMTLIGVSIAALNQVLSPAGFNIGMNLGKVAGAGVVDHLHMHVVPRWHGDVNFMSVCAETRLIPEALNITYDNLLPIVTAEIGNLR
jgi:ATP adenylyltransferase